MSFRSCHKALAVGFGWVLLPCALAAGPDDVDYRQNVMKTLGAQVEALQLVLEGRAPRDDVVHHLAALAATSRQISPAFQPAAAGGNAKPEIWDEWEDFRARANAQTERLAVLRDVPGAAELPRADIRGALGCTQCHEKYRLDMSEAQFESGDDPGQDSIDYRRYLMRAMDAQTAALGQILAWMVADGNFVAHVESIRANAHMAVGAFESAVPGGESLPRVWTDREDFASRMQALADDLAQTSETARQLGKDAALVPLLDALTCDQCHDLYRRQD